MENDAIIYNRFLKSIWLIEDGRIIKKIESCLNKFHNFIIGETYYLNNK